MATNIGPKIGIDGEAEYRKQINNIIQQAKTLDSEMKAVTASFTKDTTAKEKNAATSKILSEQISVQKKRIEELSGMLEKSAKKYGENDTSTLKWKEAVNNATAELKRLEAQQRDSADATDELGDAMDDAQKSASNFGDAMTAAGKKVSDAAKKIASDTKWISASVAGALAVSAKSAIDFESAFTGVEKTVDGTTEQIDDLRQGIIEMSEEIPASTTEIAAVAEVAGQLGIGVEDIEDFTRVMIDLGESTNLSAEEAASALAKYANITGTSADDYSRLGSVIVALGNNFATTESDIVEMATRLASAGTIAGLSETEILALATAMSSVGIEAEAGGTAMSQTLTQISKAVDSGGDKLDTLARISGMSAQEFSDSWKNEPIVALQAFIDGLGRLNEEDESTISLLDELGMEGIRQSNMLQALSLSSDMVADAVQTSNTAWSENSALSAEAEKRYGTTASQLEMTRNRINNMAIELGNKLLPVIEDVLSGVNDLVSWFTSLDDQAQNTILIAAALVAAISPVAKTISGLSDAFTFFGETVIPKVGSALSFLAANPIVLVIAAIAAFVAAIAVFGDEIQAVLQKVDDFLQNVFAMDFREILGPFFGGILNNFVANIKSMWDSIKRIFDGIIDFIRGVFTGDWERAWNGIKNIFGTIMDGLIALAKAPINGVIGLLNMAINGINSLVDGINKISFDVPDWVPGLGGKKFGFNIPKIPNIPYLAKGGILSSGSAIVGEKGAELLTIVNGKAKVTPLTGTNAFKGIQTAAYLPQAPGVYHSQATSNLSPTIQITINATDAESFERSGVTDEMVEAISEKLGILADRQLRAMGVT